MRSSGRALTRSRVVTLGETRHTLRIHPPSASGALFVLAHGAGGSSQDPLLAAVCAELAARGHGTLRFDFAYRELGHKLPDRTDKLLATYRAVLGWARARLSPARVIAGGKSMGGRMTSQAQAKAAMDGVAALVFLGFPLHPAGAPATERARHLATVTVPMLFISGTRDDLATPSLLRPVVAALPGARLVELEGADHGLDVPKKAGFDPIARAADEVVTFLHRL